MANKYKLNEEGSMSLLTVIFLSLLLTILTVSFIRLAIIEQRQATDDDLTTRAFYAAESGVEDGKRALALWQSGVTINLNADVCVPAEGFSGLLSAELSTEYTCQLINLAPGDFLAELDAWEAVSIPLDSGGSGFDRVFVEWHLPELGQPYTRRANSPTDLPTVPDWTSSGYPAMLRAAVFSHSGATFTPSNLNEYALFINPAASNSDLNLGSSGQVVNGFCEDPAPSGGGYACSATITGVNETATFYLRLQALYVGTDIKVTLYNGATEVDLEDVQAAIDVTGRAGDVYRRLEARVPLTQLDYPFPDIALWSNTDICKAFSITDDPLEIDNPCPWQP